MFSNKIYLKDKELVAKNTLKLIFAKPFNFDFLAGQYVRIGIEPNNEQLSRFLTIASAPRDQNLEFITRLSDSDFKRRISKLKIGDEVYISNAIGNLILDNSNDSVVFLCGGIGITPFRSILRQASYSKSSRKFIIFYSNHSVERTVDLIELKNLPLFNYKLIFTFTAEVESDKFAENGFINKVMLLKYLPELARYKYYIAGTDYFVKAMVDLLEASNIPNNQIRKETFIGYKDA